MLAIVKGSAPKNNLCPVGIGSVWLLCTVCGQGAWAVVEYGNGNVRQYPAPLPLETVDRLSEEVLVSWNEARSCFAANAFTACTLMCRKIIFHMAVDKGLPAENAKGFAPSFFDCVDYLVEESFITERQRQEWVDSLRLWGNIATHTLGSVTLEVASQALKFTYYLLQMVYEFPAAAHRG